MLSMLASYVMVILVMVRVRATITRRNRCMACGSSMRMRCMGMGIRAEIASSLGLGRRVGRRGMTWGSMSNANAFA
jgi:hypothetical protein